MSNHSVELRCLATVAPDPPGLAHELWARAGDSVKLSICLKRLVPCLSYLSTTTTTSSLQSSPGSGASVRPMEIGRRTELPTRWNESFVRVHVSASSRRLSRLDRQRRRLRGGRFGAVVVQRVKATLRPESIRATERSIRQAADLLAPRGAPGVLSGARVSLT